MGPQGLHTRPLFDHDESVWSDGCLNLGSSLGVNRCAILKATRLSLNRRNIGSKMPKNGMAHTGPSGDDG